LSARSLSNGNELANQHRCMVGQLSGSHVHVVKRYRSYHRSQTSTCLLGVLQIFQSQRLTSQQQRGSLYTQMGRLLWYLFQQETRLTTNACPLAISVRIVATPTLTLYQTIPSSLLSTDARGRLQLLRFDLEMYVYMRGYIQSVGWVARDRKPA